MDKTVNTLQFIGCAATLAGALYVDMSQDVQNEIRETQDTVANTIVRVDQDELTNFQTSLLAMSALALNSYVSDLAEEDE
jgi:hypothetical protein